MKIPITMNKAKIGLIIAIFSYLSFYLNQSFVIKKIRANTMIKKYIVILVCIVILFVFSYLFIKVFKISPKYIAVLEGIIFGFIITTLSIPQKV